MAVFVMVIDDSAVIRKILETCLHRAGYKVKSFEDGVRALLWLNSSEARTPALIGSNGARSWSSARVFSPPKHGPALRF